MRRDNLKKKFICLFMLTFLTIASIFAPENYVGAMESSDYLDSIDSLSYVDLSEIDFDKVMKGETVKLGDLEVKHNTWEETAKSIAQNTDQSEEKVLAELNKVYPQSKRCSNGTVSFIRTLDVSLLYKPKLEIFTVLCENSSGTAYVVDEIVSVTLHRKYNVLTYRFDGQVEAKAINNGRTLFWLVNGEWYRNGTQRHYTINASVSILTVGFSVSSPSGHVKYYSANENIRLY
jgi:hypothetical protein